jgi:hypothetical protein
MMHTSKAYGLTIRSSFPFPELTPAPVDAAVDVTVELEHVEPAAPVLSEPGLSFWAGPGEAKLTYDGVGTYHVAGGRRMTIDALPGVDNREVRFFALGPAMAMLLHQRALLPLHANAVNVNGVGVLFMGFSGCGKSTTAAALCARGHQLIADDISPVRWTDGGPVVLPGWPHMRLLPQSMTALGARMSGPTLHGRTDKYAWHAQQFAPAPVPLGRIYLLTNGERIEIDPLRPSDAFGQLVAGTYPVAARLMQFDGGTAGHFKRCVAAARRATVAWLRRPRALELLPDLCQAIEADVVRSVAA